MQPDEVRRLVALLDTRSAAEEEDAWGELRQLEESVVPFLLEFYPKCRTWQGRNAIVFHSLPYARTSDGAFELGARALTDRSFVVRYRGCQLLAYSLRDEALPFLHELLHHKDSRTVEDARAAIDAIEHKHHHLFVDRNHTGQVRWVVNDSDSDGAV